MKRIYLNTLLSVAALVLIVLMHQGQFDDIGEHYTEEGLKRALITYGIARGLNAVISVAQGTEVAVGGRAP
jgi:preprotein translocase subunit SecG